MIIRTTVIFASFLLLSTLVCSDAENMPLYNCSNDSAYDVNSTSGRAFRHNLETLLSVLSSNASNPNGFYNSTVGTVHGLFLCRGDVEPSECKACLTNATAQILNLCPNQTGGFSWYDNCMLRFSNNQSIFSTFDDNGGWCLCDEQNVTSSSELALLDEVLKSNNLLNQVAKRAAYVHTQGEKRFGTYGAKYPASDQMVYTLGQCYPGLSYQDCKSCLTNAIYDTSTPECCYNRRGGRTVYPSCDFRYELFQFYYQAMAVPPAPPPSQEPSPPPPLLPVSPSARNSGERGSSTKTTVAIVVPILVSISLVVVVFCIARKAKKRKMHDAVDHKAKGESGISTDHDEFMRYNFSQVQACTSNFSTENIIGQGGFGPVYKGTFPNGQIVAVKRLSKSSKQGGGEFTNEIALVAKLQHRNLVRLLGYCLEREERILIYEFVVNKSLDYFIFDPEKQPLLDWLMRYKIIEGIARGLLYLHEDSRIKIIHRDLKAGNVLLDENMNPKIADFGLARLFQNDQSEGNTRKLAGTFGYMAPEYIIHGMLSVKSDVFSFGVLVMEIISGKRNNNVQCFGGDNLLTYAWKQWRNGTPLAVIDPTIYRICYKNEVIRCIHIGLLCVVENVERRPTMASVVLMLSSCLVPLPNPNAPAFFDRGRTSVFSTRIPATINSNKRSPQPETSINEMSITEIYAR